MNTTPTEAEIERAKKQAGWIEVEDPAELDDDTLSLGVTESGVAVLTLKETVDGARYTMREFCALEDAPDVARHMLRTVRGKAPQEYDDKPLVAHGGEVYERSY